MPEAASAKQGSFNLQSSLEREGKDTVEVVEAEVSSDGCLETTEKHRAGIHHPCLFHNLELKSWDETSSSDPGQTGHFIGWENQTSLGTRGSSCCSTALSQYASHSLLLGGRNWGLEGYSFSTQKFRGKTMQNTEGYKTLV